MKPLNIAQDVKDMINRVRQPMIDIYVDSVNNLIKEVYAAQNHIYDNKGNKITKMDPYKIPECLIFEDNEIKINKNIPKDKLDEFIHDIGIHEVYGNHPKSIIQLRLADKKWQKSVMDKAIKLARKI